MADPTVYTMHRPELLKSLQRGEEKIARLMRDRSKAVSAKTTLVEAGTALQFVYRIRRGWAGRVRSLKDGRTQLILIYLPGDLFAVKSLFLDVHPDTIEILSDAVIEQIDHRSLKAQFDADHDIAIRCTWQIVEEERRLHDWVVGLGQGSTEERMALLFLDFRNRLILAGAIGPDATEFDVPMTQQQLGDHLGITTVHVNRVLRKLREAGVMSMRDQRIAIADLGALAQIADPLLSSDHWIGAASPGSDQAQPVAGTNHGQ